MDYAARKALYKSIEKQRDSRVIGFITGDRQHLETQIAQDAVPRFVDLLDEIGPTKKISLVLHTNGGQTSAAWRLVNLIRMYCDELEVIVPAKALSAGTLISLGADRIVMTKQAALGPIDPSVVHALSPIVNDQGMAQRVPVSVEAVRGYLGHASEDLRIADPAVLGNILIDLSNKIHPLVLGEIFRSRAQIRYLADKLLGSQVKDKDKIKQIIDFLCADSGSHDYTINRREAQALGLNVEKPSDELYEKVRAVEQSFSKEMKFLEPHDPLIMLGGAQELPLKYTLVRGLIESRTGGCHRFLTEGSLSRPPAVPNAIQLPPGFPPGFPMQGVPQGPAYVDQRTFEGWRKL